MNLVKLTTDAYWHERHKDCIIDASCRFENALLELADAVVPEEPDPGANATLAGWTAWAERMRIRRILLANVH